MPHFTLATPEGAGLTDPVAADLALLDRLGTDPEQALPVAQMWTAPTSLVVPRSYQRHGALDAVRERFAAQGCPVYLRPSGGGLVPQGAGILNLSLAYVVRGLPGEWAEPIYLHLCELLRGPLDRLGVQTHWQAVAGSFCDGRFNLACTHEGRPRKIAGTAQYWRPLPAPPGTAMSTSAGSRTGLLRPHAVLAHAVLLVDTDLEAAHVRANAFEQALGSGLRYDPASTLDVARAMGLPAGTAADAGPMQALQRLLGEAVRQAGPPQPAHAA